MIKNLVLFLLFTFTFIAFSQNEDALPSSKQNNKNANNSLKDVPAELKQKMQKFYNLLLDNKVPEAYDELLHNSPIKRKADEIKSLISQTKRTFEIYGAIMGYEPIDSRLVSSSYLRVRYLGLHSRYPLRWIFTYYKSPDLGWIITDVKFDDLTDYFFEE